MKFQLEIDMDNAAFEERPSGTEVARILRGLAEKLDGFILYHGEQFPVWDINGNGVGGATIDRGDSC